MKTLDEVIQAQETCLRGACDKCSYDNSNFDICDVKLQSDVLYYLKKLKRIEEKMEKIAIGNIEDTLSKIDNPALTWEELQQMVGKPIWVEYEGFAPDWEVIEYVGNTKWKCGEIIETQLSILHKEDQDKTWNAYRKERI